MSLTFVTGGARSGKSRFAESLVRECVLETPDCRVCFIATGVAMDDEMKARIARHRNSRPEQWDTVEEPLDVAGVIQNTDYDVYLIDCLSFLLNNWMFHEVSTEEQFFARLGILVQAMANTRAKCVVVSNEVGFGIIPADEETRRYRDWLGWMNQAFARVSDPMYLVVSGIALDVKHMHGATVVT